MRVPAQAPASASLATPTPRPSPRTSIGRRFSARLGPAHVIVLAACALAQLPGFSQAQGRHDQTTGIVVADASASGWAETGTASWYGPGFAGRTTASGETYDPHNLTAAHRSLPLGSLVRVQNLDNDRNMVVRINDRGPFVNGRVIDVSQAAAEVLGFRSDGLTKVRITSVAPPPTATAAPARSAMPAAAPRSAAPAAAVPPATDSAPAGGDGASTTTAPEDEAPAFVTESSLRAGGPSPFFIQIGAFRENRHAQELLQSAGSLGLALQVESSDGMYRVIAGPFESSAAAQDAADEIQSVGLTAFVRRGR